MDNWVSVIRTDSTKSDEHVASPVTSPQQPSGFHGNSHRFKRSMSVPASNSCNHGNLPLLSPSADPSDVELLAKLEEANRQLEADRRSLQSLSPSSKGHSRQGSISSVISNTSISSNTSNNQLDDISAAKPEDLWEIWGKLVSDWDNVARRKASYIRELVRKGIPHHFRGIVWQLLCNAQDCPVKQQFAEYLKTASPCEKMIRRDITRTYPEHNFFKEKDGLGQESLFNVMKAYSIHDREVGYCQGSGFIVGLILMQMPEEEAFAVTVKIMQDYKMRDIFKPSMAELGLCMFQLECMIQEHLPNLYSHFQVHGFYVSMFASSWFLTLFTQTLPIPVACRIFDVFLVEGLEMIFRVGFAILQLILDELLARDMEGMITFLQKDMPRIISADPELLLTTAFQIKFNAKKMKKSETNTSLQLALRNLKFDLKDANFGVL
ncbi:hypothetical protein LSH36_462g01015 [Paralvinella palmiformis]|uniref:Rab-GAP TBC domain-containing protein n=1 Tax=Paralvinella palmiformis TaxID=53620 RepID=A0AAD9JAX7_9ANNE|nr:hypothetical protein LSH36_462g01015 [Paralvinella palmiformis]